jgi:hypothetical protein
MVVERMAAPNSRIHEAVRFDRNPALYRPDLFVRLSA